MVVATSLADAVLTGVVMFLVGAVLLTYLMIGALRRASEHDAAMRRPMPAQPGPASSHSNRTNIVVHGGIHITVQGTTNTPSIEQLLAELPVSPMGQSHHELSHRPMWELER